MKSGSESAAQAPRGSLHSGYCSDGTDREGNTYNINADLVAGAIAGALRAEKLVMMTDIKGIRDAKGRHLSTVSRKDVQRMVKKGTITEGMLPKSMPASMRWPG